MTLHPLQFQDHCALAGSGSGDKSMIPVCRPTGSNLNCGYPGRGRPGLNYLRLRRRRLSLPPFLSSSLPLFLSFSLPLFLSSSLSLFLSFSLPSPPSPPSPPSLPSLSLDLLCGSVPLWLILLPGFAQAILLILLPFSSFSLNAVIQKGRVNERIRIRTRLYRSTKRQRLV